MKIDFHTHCFPDALAPRAMAALHQNFTRISMKSHTDGTAKGAKELLGGIGVDHAVVCNIATNAHQESKVNDFAIALAQSDPFFYPLGSIHPDSERKDAELARLQAAGIKGIKLHPDYVGVLLSDPRFDEIFSLLEARDMFCVLHSGFDPVSPDFIHAPPRLIREALERHPRLKLISAHMGGYEQARGVMEELLGTSVYFDTSLCSFREPEREMLIEILHRHDEDRILFATDTPWSNPVAEIAFLESAGLSEERLDKIYSKNAMRLLGISN